MMRSPSFPRRLGRLLTYAIALSLLISGSAFAQLQTGNVFGTVVDNQGAAIPGVTVTITGPGAPGVFVTDSDGQFRFLNLSPGVYAVRAELAGFGNVLHNNLAVNVGRNSEVTLTLAPALEQTITVTAETPLLDVRKVGTGSTVERIELEQVPSARDPWVVLQQVPGVLIDRINVGGNESGQQSTYTGKGASGDQATWNVDGVNITDMAAVGSSPTYYDFDSFEEMQATTGGSDPRVMTPGVQLNMVTKRGTNEFRGSGRYYITDNDFQEEAVVPEEARTYLAKANEIDHIDDYGLEVGGPLWRDRLWIWGAYSKNQIDNLTAQTIAASGAIGGGSFDKTTLENWNGKLNAQLLSNNSATFLYTLGDKIKLGRSVGPLRPPETGHNQSGPTNLYKLEDTHIFSPNFYLTGLASKVDGGFGFEPAGGMDVDLWFDEGFIAHRSYYQYKSDRPQENYRADASTFFDTGSMNHELKFGFGYRDTPTTSVTTWPGSGNYSDFSCGECSETTNIGLAYLTRNGFAPYGTNYKDLYVGDTILMGNLTVQAGLRYDIQTGSNSGASVGANSVVPDLLPEATSAGDSEELEWTSISPRLGATYSFGSTRRTLVRGAYNRYVDQLSAGVIAPGAAFYSFQALVYYFEDANRDRVIQRGEILFDRGLYNFYGLDPDNPGSAEQPVGRLDYNMEAPTTDEFIFGIEHELMPEFTIGANYTHRNFNDFLWTVFEKHQGQGDFHTAADYVLAGTVTGTTPEGEAFSAPYYSLRPGLGTPFKVTTNRPGYEQTYDGFEINATKRLSNRWMLRGNISLNDWNQSVTDEGIGSINTGYTTYLAGDPTQTLTGYGCSSCDGATVVESAGLGSGAKGSIYINSGWAYNLTGLVQLPWDITVGAGLMGREGYPLPYYRRAGNKNVLVAGVDPVRLDDIMNLDIRIGKEIKMGPVGVTLSVDAFNVTDERTILQRQHRLDVTTANRILELQSPRVFRFGARLNF